MSTSHLLDTKTVSLNDILGNGKVYQVPQFQRDYSWEQDNWEDLWSDIEIAMETGSLHYMGSVVLQSNDNKRYNIIDGQQRFTTLTILILATIKKIKELVTKGIDKVENEERIEILMRQYIGQKDPSSLNYSSKLFLNENNDSFYQNRLLNFRDPLNIKKLSDSEKLMWDAYLYYQQKIEYKFRNNSGADLASFLNNVTGELMMFIQITVEDELNAYTVFETLNSRGVELTSTDLLKNYLFSLVAKSHTDLKQVKNQWKKIVDTVGLKDFPVFLRYFLVATRKQITKEYLFKEIKNFAKTDQDVFDLLDRLEYYAYNYVALGNPDDETWNKDKELRKAITVLKAFRVTQWKPLAMVASEKFDGSTLKRLLNSIISISYRYNVIAKLQTNEMEKVYSRAAINLFRTDNPNIHSVLNDLKAIYVIDEDFKNYFILKQFNTSNSTDKKLLRYTLYNLEAQEESGCACDFEVDEGTIEHILPESYPESWFESFDEDSFDRHVYMVGNLTLLEPSKNNKEASNKTIDEKIKVYSTSKYAITKWIKDPQWTAYNIKSRQAHLAKLACAVWQINF